MPNFSGGWAQLPIIGLATQRLFTIPQTDRPSSIKYPNETNGFTISHFPLLFTHFSSVPPGCNSCSYISSRSPQRLIMNCFSNSSKLNYTMTKFDFSAVPRRVLLIALVVPTINALHHMIRREPLNDLSVRAETRPLSITNSCQETIYPGIVTQTGIAPSLGGFQLLPGASRNFTVSGDWQGRVWGRTNCSFNSAGTGPSSGGYGKACSTGDCGGIIDCKATVSSGLGCALLSQHC